MNLETAIQFTDNYFKKLESWKRFGDFWTDDFLELQIKKHEFQEDVFCVEVFNQELSYYMISFFEIPESESDYHTILSLLKIH